MSTESVSVKRKQLTSYEELPDDDSIDARLKVEIINVLKSNRAITIEHLYSCPAIKVVSDGAYSNTQKGFLCRVIFPILLKDFSVNLDYSSPAEVLFKIEKFNNTHSALEDFYEVRKSIDSGENEYIATSLAGLFGKDLFDIYIAPGDYYFSLQSSSSGISFAYKTNKDSDKWGDNLFVATNSGISGMLPGWTMASPGTTWSYLFEMVISIERKNLSYSKIDFEPTVDHLIDGGSCMFSDP